MNRGSPPAPPHFSLVLNNTTNGVEGLLKEARESLDGKVPWRRNSFGDTEVTFAPAGNCSFAAELNAEQNENAGTTFSPLEGLIAPRPLR